MLAQRRISNVIPLPGVHEIESVVTGLINAVKATGYEKDQCESLARRLDSLIAATDACKEHADFAELLNLLQDVKSRFETKLKHKSKLPGVLRVQDRLRAYEHLSSELTELVERAQLTLSTINQIKMNQLNSILTKDRAATNRRSIEKNFETIRECDICFDHKQPTWTPSSEFVLRRDPVETGYRRGRLGKLHVTYVTFSARSNHVIAAQRAEQELKRLSRMRHPNAAVAVGVTRGYDGLNGFVVATDGIPLIKALEISVAGGFLARCLKGLTQALAFFREQEYSVGLDYRGDGVTVAPDGHITVLMFKTSLSTTNSIRPDWARDPTANILLRMYYRATLEYAQGDHPKAEQMSRILGFLTTLGRSHLTELQLLNMAADCGLDPFDSNHWWDNTVTPPSTIHCGDLVRIANHHPEGVDWRVLGEGWEVLEECNNAAEGLDIGCRWGLACYQDCGWERLLRIRAGYRTWVTSCHHVSIMSPQVHTNNKPNWKNVMERAMKLSKQHKINLRHISYVTSTKMSITAERLKSSIHPASEAVLYFHRNPFSRSSLRVFYGFFSASRDPCAPSTGLKDTEWRFTHRIEYNDKCIGDDWRLQYQRALESGLATIPGAYLGASVQELSNDETE